MRSLEGVPCTTENAYLLGSRSAPGPRARWPDAEAAGRAGSRVSLDTLTSVVARVCSTYLYSLFSHNLPIPRCHPTDHIGGQHDGNTPISLTVRSSAATHPTLT